MNYTESREQSAEILRMILPLMARQTAPYHPPTYTLWYEYVANLNPPLKEAVDRQLSAGSPLDEEQVNELYRSYIGARNDELARRLESQLRRIVQSVSQSTASADLRAQQYGETLQEQSEKLNAGVDHATLEAVLRTLTAETQQMRVSMATLRSQLSEATREAEQLRNTVQRLQSEAITDPLTGLLNRRGFEEAMRAVLESANGDSGNTCLVMADIDNFKDINDTHGHLFGDKVICAVAKALKTLTKGQDAIARLGGEEFALLLPNTPVHGAWTLAENIRATIERGRIRRTETSEPVGNITISLGVAAYRPGMSLEDFVHAADQALYASKHGGRNRVTVRYPQAA